MSLCDAVQSVLLNPRLRNSRRQAEIHHFHHLSKGKPWDPFINSNYKGESLESDSQNSADVLSNARHASH